MTNEYTVEKNKELIERYPYLMPRNVWTGEIPEDYDYSYINGIGEIPDGWNKLFLQMCEDIRQPLIDADYLEQFRFSQIKEKYNTLRAYTFGCPKAVQDILNKYEYVSQFVCTRCGKPATYETSGYIASYCTDCWKDFARHEKVEFIEFKPIMRIEHFSKAEGKRVEEIDCSDIWDKIN